ncbi:MAG TPA: serine hydrolase domain-containing protein [Actinocrinis sp.]
MAQDALSEFVEAAAAEHGIPGAAVGVWAQGREIHACHGVTSIENPLPVDQDTLFRVASITKTYTATALMRLVADGRVALDAPVRTYVPELVLADEAAAEEVTVLHLLNHTAGLDWALIAETGDGDDALAAYVARMAELKLIAPLGARASYSQAGFNLAGRVVEKATGMTYERAVASLVLEPLGLERSFFDADSVMTRRFAMGHNRGEDGDLSVARPWRVTRGNNPGGGLVSSAADQLRWARFHMGDGRAPSGVRVLPAELLERMREPTVALRASALGDALGISWLLRDVDGLRIAGHGGSANGQFAELWAAPEREFAVVSLANAGPDGIPFNKAVVRWVLEHYLGVVDRDPEPLPYDEARAREIVGRYEIDAMTLTISAQAPELMLEVVIKPEIRAAADPAPPPDHAPFAMGLLPAADEYVLTAGALAGQRGFFTRDAGGAVVGVDLAGRLFSRVAGA